MREHTGVFGVHPVAAPVRVYRPVAKSAPTQLAVGLDSLYCNSRTPRQGQDRQTLHGTAIPRYHHTEVRIKMKITTKDRMAFARVGSVGGKTSASNMTPAERSERARKAVTARWANARKAKEARNA